MKTLSVILLLIFSSTLSFSQPVTGKIIDSDTRSPLEFTSIGILKRNKGVICDHTGYFSLNFGDDYNDDTLIISAVGYEPVYLVVYQIKNVFRQNNNTDIVIELKKKLPVMAAVQVTPSRFIKKTIGNKGRRKPLTIEYERVSPHEPIMEVGTVLTIKTAPAFVTNANFVINGNKYKDSVDFRINIYSMENGIPYFNLLSELIIVRSNMKEGVLSVDLKKYNIYVYEDIFLSLQWSTGGNPGSLSFGGGILGNKSFHRLNNDGAWDTKFILTIDEW